MTELFTGLCESWNDKGWGRVRLDGDGGRSLFCHASEIRASWDHRRLVAGQAVEFEIGQDSQGRLRCENVVKIEQERP